MDLNNKIWQEIEGAYRVPYDASIVLSQLDKAYDPEEIVNLINELWTELHHQGDVGLASYLSLPQLVKFGKSKVHFHWNLLGLCCMIEQQRHLNNNPILPPEFMAYYEQGLAELNQFVIDNIKNSPDELTFQMALATLATCAGNYKLGKAIIELGDTDIMNTFLDQF